MRLPRYMTDGDDIYGRELNGRGFASLVIAAVLIAVSMVIGGAYVGTRWSCSQLGDQTGHSTRYHFISGCYIDLPGLGWVPRDQWRNVNIAPQPTPQTSRG